MTTESFFALAIAAMLTLFLGSVLAFGGYRFFVVLLPIFGFLFGFGFGAHTIQAIFGDAFLSTVSSWVVGLLFAVSFAVASYAFYFMAVSLVAGALGYALSVGLMQAIGFDLGFLVWLVGVIAAIALAVAVLWLNIQKYAVIAATALLGAGVIVGTFLFLFGGLPSGALVQNPVRQALQSSPFWLIVFLIIAALGGAAQYLTTRGWEIETFNRLTGMSDADQLAPAAGPTP